MSRTPVGLVNHPATNFNWRLSVSHGCLIWRPVLPDFACGSGKGVKQQAALKGCSGRREKTNSEIAEPRACRLAFSEAKKDKTNKHVEACLEASRDGGSNPPASILRRSLAASYAECPA